MDEWWWPCDQSLRIVGTAITVPVMTLALRCREPPKKWTQAKIAVALGVGRQTVTDWFDISIAGSGNAYIDARLSVTAEAKSVIIEQSAEGVAQKQLAADFGISQQRVSQIVTTAAAKTVSVGVR